MELVDPSCFVPLSKPERLEQLYLAYGGTECFMGRSWVEQLRMLAQQIGVEGCIFSEVDLYRVWLALLDSEACSQQDIESLQAAVYALLYAAAGDTSLVSPACFRGLSPDLKELAIFASAGGIPPLPPILSRTSSGLLLNEEFSTLWTNTGGWSSVAEVAPISFGRLNLQILNPGPTTDKTGVREFQGVRTGARAYNGIWDGGTGVAGPPPEGWRQQIGTTGDSFWSVSRIGPTSEGLAHVGGGPDYLAQFTGWYEIRAGVHIRRRGTANALFAIPGLPATPYGGDVWTASSFNGSYTGVRTDFETPANSLPGSVVLSGGLFYHFVQVGVSVHIYTSTTATGVLTDTGEVLPTIRQPVENPKAFFHAGISKWVCLCNTIADDAATTQENVAFISSSLTDWSAATVHFYMKIGPLDGQRQIGVATHLTAEDGVLVADTNRGVIPVFYDESTENNGNHEYRRISTALLEFSTHCARFNSGSTGRISKTLTHSNFVANFAVRFNNTDSSAKLAFAYRQDGSGNGYRLIVRNQGHLLLEKIVAGVTTTVQSASTGQAIGNDAWYRVTVEVSGSSHNAYVNGISEIIATDAAHASGTVIAFDGDAADGDIRLPRIRLSDTLTITGLEPGAVVRICATTEQLPAATGYADGDGEARITSNVWPLDSIEIDGSNYKLPSNAPFYGGDVLAFSDLSTAGYAPDADANLVLQFDASQETLTDQSAVVTITDFSPSGSNITQAIAGNRPIFEKRVQNGLPGFWFDGGDYLSNSTFAALDGASAAAWLIVLRFHYEGGGNIIPVASGADQIRLQYQSHSYYGFTDGSNSGAAPAFPRYKTVLVSCAFDGSLTGNANRFKMWIDGVQQTLTFSGTIPSTLPTGAGITLGAYTGGVVPWKGHIFELLARTAVPDMDQFNAYAMNKWGVRLT